MKQTTIIMLIAISTFLFRCGEENSGPTESQAPSTPYFIYDDSDPNNIVFTVTSDIEDLSISWDFGNGETSSDSIATAYYPTLGEYTVTLTVSNEAGSTSYEEEIVVKLVEPDVPNFSYDDSNLNNIVFTVTSDIESLSINWDFGNGQTSSDSVVTVYYKSSGKYTVSLTVSNKAGSTSYKEEIVFTVEPPAVPSFDADVYAGYVIYTVTSETEGLIIDWDFGNGLHQTKEIDSAYYPFPGTYTVTLNVANSAGAKSYKEDVVVTEGDPAICENQDYILLTGGCDVVETGKTWVWDRESIGHRAIGPPVYGASTYNDPIDVSWWEQSPNAFPEELYNDEYIFKLRGLEYINDFQYINDCKAEFHWDWAWANELMGTEQEEYQDTCLPYAPPSFAQWQLEVDGDGNKILTLTPEGSTTADVGSFLGCRMNPCVYQILTLEENYMYVRFEYWKPEDAANTGANRAQWNYMKFVPAQ